MTDPTPSSQSGLMEPEQEPAAPSPEAPIERPAFRAIFEREYAYVSHTLRRLGVAERDLEDLAHDVFVAVYRSLDDYDPSRPLRPWLFGTAFRIASDYRRLARHRLEMLDVATEAVDDAPPVDHRIAEIEAQQLVLDALATLDLERRAVLVMHDLDGHTMPEIAEAMSVPLNTAYSRLRLAREQFKGAVRRLRRRGGE
jgi:RNA polymerase sigma-70 factor, ECF subfamily